ncbi:MAG: uracil-DNA glycosylase [Deltaproteobacteria bacterium]|nr:uracil-DNA glycosylase [Deltaproteobacteria bacterium]
MEQFITALKNSPPSQNVFNPWWQTDLKNDIDQLSPLVRRRQLLHYLKERQGRAKYLLLGEALGYQGGHFSGIAMTSERILLGGLVNKGIEPHHVLSTITPTRTSRPSIKAQGFTEPTATMVWQFMLNQTKDPRCFVIWNAFSWHPFNPNKGYLSNRTPTPDEFKDGKAALNLLVRLCDAQTIVAIGEKAAVQLGEMGITAHKVRHPANGGANKFRDQMSAIIG